MKMYNHFIDGRYVEPASQRFSGKSLIYKGADSHFVPPPTAM